MYIVCATQRRLERRHSTPVVWEEPHLNTTKISSRFSTQILRPSHLVFNNPGPGNGHRCCWPFHVYQRAQVKPMFSWPVASTGSTSLSSTSSSFVDFPNMRRACPSTGLLFVNSSQSKPSRESHALSHRIIPPSPVRNGVNSSASTSQVESYPLR